MIISNGSDNALIMFIGDYGMREDIGHGYALSGKQEETLQGFCYRAGLKKSEIYKTLLIKDILDYDGKSKSLKFQAIKKAYTDAAGKGINYETILREEILGIKPNIIVPLGDLSLRFISGYGPISNYRGSVLPLNPFIQTSLEKTIRVIGTLSPRATWENYTSRVYVQLDFNKISRLKGRSDPIEIPGSVWVCRRLSEFRAFLDRQRDFYSRPLKDQFITFDIETYLGLPTAISFCFDGHEAVSIPLLEIEKMDYANMILLYFEIAKLLASSIPKVGQNVKFDWNGCERFGMPVSNVVGDTAVGFNVLYPELPKNLGFQTSIYTDLPYFKDESNRKEIAFNPKAYTKDTLYIYNAKDSLADWQIHRKHQDEMEELGVANLYNNKLVPLISIYRDIDNRGLRVDPVRKKKLYYKYKALLDVTAQRFINLVKEVDLEFESVQEAQAYLRSPTKLGHLIYEVLKYPVRYTTTEAGKKNFKTDKETLDELMILYGDSNRLRERGKKVLSLAVSCRKLTKVIEYILTPLHPDGTFRTSYNLGGTENARTSASKTTDTILEFDKKGNLVWPMKRLGRSLQTITKHGFDIDGEIYDTIGDERLGQDLRSMFVPRKGKCFIEWDKSQAEARVVAVLAEDYDLLQSFDTKPKIHAKTAGLIFDVDPSTITSSFPIVPGVGMTYYDLGKRATHATNLGLEAFRLSQMTHLEMDFCKQVLIKIHAARPKIRGVFHFETYSHVKKHGYLRSPFGRIRQFFGRMDTIAKEVYSNLPQSTVSDEVKFRFPQIIEACPYIDLLYEGHDAGMGEVPIERRFEFCEKIKPIVEQPISFLNCSLSRDFELVIPAEFQIGLEDWASMEKVEMAKIEA